MSFFTSLGDDRYLASPHTSGPWDPQFQHGGPPSALLGRALEQTAPRDDMMVARVTVEILGAIPVGELTVGARLVRPGRSVEMLEAVMTAGGRAVAQARAWRVTRTQGVSVPSRRPGAPRLPPAGPPREIPGWGEGYVQAIEWRWVTGFLTDPGPAVTWARMLHPLVDDEVPSPLTRVLSVADSGSGASSELAFATWHFINPELTMHLHREPVGEWICLDAVTTISEGGVGLATSQLSDQHGPLGVGAQSLLVQSR